MKELKVFINEKLHVNKFKSKINKFAEYLGITPEEAKPMEKYFEIDCLHPFANREYNDFLNLFGLAVLLTDDGNDQSYLSKIGKKGYKLYKYGKNNPYDYWYDAEEDSMGIDLLEFIDEKYGRERHEDNEEMRDAFDDMIKFCQKFKVKPKDTIDKNEFIKDFGED